MPQYLVSQADVLTEAERILAAMQANDADIAHLSGSRDKLQSHLEMARELSRQQSSLAASKQEATSQLQQTLHDLAKLIHFLRIGFKEHYGTRSEKLVDYGVKPFRGRPRRVQAPPTPPASATE
jgi:hypothetical protein